MNVSTTQDNENYNDHNVKEYPMGCVLVSPTEVVESISSSSSAQNIVSDDDGLDNAYTVTVQDATICNSAATPLVPTTQRTTSTVEELRKGGNEDVISEDSSEIDGCSDTSSYTEGSELEEDDMASFEKADNSMLSISPIKPRSAKRRVCFAPDVTVMPIPSHRIYTLVEKAQMWSNLSELRAGARRNTFEWFWEGCDMKNVVEETDFLRDEMGNLVHPAHWVPYSDQS